MSKSLGYIDIAAVKAAVSLKQVLEHYGVLDKLTPSGAGLRGCCPIHNGNDPKQFSVNLERGLWKCFSECSHGGNNLDFVMHKDQCNSQEAAWLLNGWFNLGHEQRAAVRLKPERTDKPAWRQPVPPQPAPTRSDQPSSPTTHPLPPKTDESAEETGENEVLGFKLDNLDGSHPYLAGRGLSAAAIAHFGIGYCPKGIMAGRIAIPIHNTAGLLVANAGRWPGDPPEGKEKYRLPGKFKKTLEVFNYHRAALEPDTSPLVIVEGFFGVMHLWQLGLRRVVALMGWHLSTRQEELISRLVMPDSRIILMPDNDEAGITARQKVAPRLAEHCFVRSFRWPEGVTEPDQLLVEHATALLL